MRRAIGFAFIAASLGCGSKPTLDSPNNVTITQVSPSNAKGAATGIVFDAKNAPIKGAKVHCVASDYSSDFNTDDRGGYAFKDIPAGGFASLSVTADGYTSALAVTFVPVAAGTVPINDGGAVNVFQLFKLSGKVDVQVVGWDGQSPAAVNGTLTVNFPNGSTTLAPVIDGTYAAGVLSFQNTPQLNDLIRNGIGVTVTVDDPGNKYAGQAVAYTAERLAGSGGNLIITLDQYGSTGGAPKIVATNVPNLKAVGKARASLVSSAGPLTVIFDRKVAPPEVQVTDELGSFQAVKVDPVNNGFGINISPKTATAPWNAGYKYNVLMRVEAQDSAPAARATFSGPFFINFTSGTAPAVAFDGQPQFKDTGATPQKLEAGEVVEFRLLQAIGIGSGAGFSVPVYAKITGTPPAGAVCVPTKPCYAAAAEPADGTLLEFVSGYTTKFSFTWSGPTVDVGTPLVIDLSEQWKLLPANGWVENILGDILGNDQVSTNDPSANLKVAP